MSPIRTDHDVTRAVRSWLEEGVTALPDRVLDDVLDQLPSTPQRRAWWPARRFHEMTNPLKLVLATAAIGVLAVVALNVTQPAGDVGGQSDAPSPSPSPIPLPDSSDLEAGSTYFMDGMWGPGSPRMILTVPAAGWSSSGGANVQKDFSTDPDKNVGTVGMTPWKVDNLKADPCRSQSGGDLDPAVGPTVDDLATALVEQAGGTPSAVTDVTLGGYSGKKVELSLPAGLDIATCEDPAMTHLPRFARWLEVGTPGGHIYGNGQRNVVYVLDVDGLRAVIDTSYLPGTSEATLAELERLVASIRIEPVALPSATARPTETPLPSD